MAYAFIPKEAVDAVPKLSGAAVRVMVALASFMRGRGQDGCYPSLLAVGERAGIKRRMTIINAIRELTAAGVISYERRRRRSSLFKWATLEVAEKCYFKDS